MPRYLTRLLVAFAAMFMLHAAPAAAQATRTWVSGVGDDANPCSRTAPCKTFAGSISKTAAGGEINCLDSGGFGGVTITKSITIRCDGVEGGILVSGTNGIIVNAASTDRVVLSGLDFEGVGTSLDGVRILSARDVIIENCEFRNFTGAAARVNATGKSRLTFSNNRVIGNGAGVVVISADGQGSAKVVGSLFIANTGAAIQVSGAGNRATFGGNKMFGNLGLELLAGGAASTFGDNLIEAPSAAATAIPRT